MEKYARNVLTEIAEYLLRERNIYIPADKFGIWVVPPLIVKKHEIDFIVDSIDEALKIADDEVTEYICRGKPKSVSFDCPSLFWRITNG